MFWNKKPPAPTPPAALVEPAEPSEPPAATLERRFTDGLSHSETVIARGITIVGDIEGQDAVEIAGHVQGDVTTRGLCRVREGGELLGRLRAAYAVIDGTTEGRIAVRRKAELGHTAHVEGNIRAQGVALAEGCFFEGRIHMQGGRRKGKRHSFQEKRRGRR